MMKTAHRIIETLIEKGLTISVAESLTGGLVCAELTSIPGASQCVSGGVVAYQTDIKSSLLSVDRSLLRNRGAVDTDVALSMAEQVSQLVPADIGLATTGVAGPDTQDGKDVGTVHIACWYAGEHRVESYHFSGSRDEIRHQSVESALRLVLDIISQIGE